MAGHDMTLGMAFEGILDMRHTLHGAKLHPVVHTDIHTYMHTYRTYSTYITDITYTLHDFTAQKTYGSCALWKGEGDSGEKLMAELCTLVLPGH